MSNDVYNSTLAERLAGLQEISLELVSAKDTSSILKLVTSRAMDLLNCDAGSLYLKEKEESLSFEVALNRSIQFNFERRSIPISKSSIASTVYHTGVSLNIADAYEFCDSDKKLLFDNGFDKSTGYRTKTILAVPLKNSEGKCLGVLQLINRKDNIHRQWPSDNLTAINSMPLFSEEDLRLIESFAAVATTAITNTHLRAEIEQLFESFIRMSVMTIDSRDPGTRGHSERVTQMTLALAKKLSENTAEEFADIHFSENDTKELYYAGLLHDFGKIAVKEATLQKEQKLSEAQRLKLEARIKDFTHAFEKKQCFELLERLVEKKESPTEFDMQRIKQNSDKFSKQLAGYHKFILDISLPTVLAEDKSEYLDQIKDLRFANENGENIRLLDDEEITSLSIKRGCLTPEERLEIESHVTRSYDFLTQIPWHESLKKIPEIAYSHHELLDGTGYPRKLKGDQIPVASRMMTICDIFDALACSDRPYKKALSIEATLKILQSMADAKKIESEFFKVFCEEKIWSVCEIYRDREAQKAA
jgi:HD-GYP domain-containing protein (c-di-GMP phosphodiesterase class II)